MQTPFNVLADVIGTVKTARQLTSRGRGGVFSAVYRPGYIHDMPQTSGHATLSPRLLAK
ncbi:hypothetical protein PSFL111601_07370 [Pseudomonas floridensis]